MYSKVNRKENSMKKAAKKNCYSCGNIGDNPTKMTAKMLIRW